MCKFQIWDMIYKVYECAKMYVHVMLMNSIHSNSITQRIQ